MDALDLIGPADGPGRVSLDGEFREVAPKTIEGGGLRLALARLPFAAPPATFFGRHIVPQKIQDFLTHVFQLETEIHQNLSRHAFLFAEQTSRECSVQRSCG